MTSRTMVVTTSVVVLLGGTARGAELSTPTMTALSLSLWCNIVNISSVSQTVRIRTYDDSGALTADTGNIVLAARATYWLGLAHGTGHCRFTTVNAKTLFRASINVYGESVMASLPAQ